MSEDTDLRERFLSLRRQDASRAPAFASMMPRRTSPVRRPFPLVTATASLGVIVLLLVNFLHPLAPRNAVALADWRSPTGFLLDTPGQDLLRTVPDIGSPFIAQRFPIFDDGASSVPKGQQYL